MKRDRRKTESTLSVSDCEEAMRAHQKKYLGGTLEWSIEEMQRILLTLTDLSIALDSERMRLAILAPGTKLPAAEIRLVRALLISFCHEEERLQKEARGIEDLVASVLSDSGVNPIVPETWFTSSARSRTRASKAVNQSAKARGTGAHFGFSAGELWKNG